MKVLITGIAGLIGSHLADYLVTGGHDVVGVDNLSIGRVDNVSSDIHIYMADCQGFLEMDDIMREEQPDIVYHMAAWAHEGLSQFCPAKITENNYQAHISVLTAAIKNKVRKYVVGSSMSVYGNQKPPFDEDMPTSPEDIYAISKVSLEQSTKILSEVHGIEYMIVRPHNVYGPRQLMNDPYRNVVAIFINKCLKGEKFYIYGDGEQKRAFSYVTDVCPAIARAGTLPISGEIVNIGPTKEYTVNELAEEVLKHFPGNPDPEYVPSRPREIKDAWCTNDKAEKLLKYETKTSFEEGIEAMVSWAKERGPMATKYLDSLEIESYSTPRTWTGKLI